MVVKFAFDGTQKNWKPAHTFVALSVFNGGKWFGCDAYFDGVGGIKEVVDWQDGNGAIANDIFGEDRAAFLARAILEENQVDNVIFESAV